MPSFTALLQQGTAHAWLFIPSAILLGVLHGLEPGHSKTMMAAFIVAIRGTVTQAVLLGLAATVSHTVVVWAIALGGLYFAHDIATASFEPYFQLASAALIIGIALWMLWRTWTDMQDAKTAHGHHDHHHDHHHHHGHAHDHAHSHDHHRAHAPAHDLDVPHEYQDSHERAHANDIRRKFASRNVTTGQIVLFGLTGGLIPCPASITILLICLQLKQFALGATLVLCFSIGLALTLVSVGAAAALGARHASQRLSWFGAVARRAPYLSGVLIILVGVYVGVQGWLALSAHAA
jgi:nickel/cobalt exporter